MPFRDMNSTIITDDGTFGPGKNVEVPESLAAHIDANQPPPEGKTVAYFTPSAADYEALETKYADLLIEKDDLSVENARLANLLTGHEGKLSEFSALMSSVQSENAGLRTKNNNLESQVANLTEQNKTLGEQAVSLTEQITTLKAAGEQNKTPETAKSAAPVAAQAAATEPVKK